MRLAVASLFTLGLLASMLGAVVLGLLYATEAMSFPVVIGLVILINLLMWLAGPRFNDFLYDFLYDIHWMSLEDLRMKSEASADVIESVCDEYGYDEPKLGLIHDSNPNAFTYGSGRWNSRVVVTEGIFEYLDDEEAASVIAHEMGHITHRDFIVMTIANTLVQLLYLVATRAFKMASYMRSGNSKRNPASFLVIIGIMSYVFYFIGQYLLYYLSRVREYYADTFAAEQTDPDLLSSALLKVAYGIMISPDDHELVNATKALGIMDVKSSKDRGMMYNNCEQRGDHEPIAKSFLFDLHNPWATIVELNSTHPLTGKRIKELSGMSSDPLFDFDRIERQYSVDTGRLYRQFGIDLLFVGLPILATVLFPIIAGIAILRGIVSLDPTMLAGSWMGILGIAMMAKTYYKYPLGDEPEQSTVIDAMADIYASPVRGQMVELDGELVGKGQAGYRFSEDLMFQDETGLMYLQYESWLPVFGNFLFSLGDVPELIGDKATVRGWFLRGMRPWIGLKELETDDRTIDSYVFLGGLGLGGLLLGIGFLITLL